MAKTTIARGNILAVTAVQATLPATTISGTSTEVNIAVGGVQSTDIIVASFDGSLLTGVSIGNAYTNTAGQVTIRLINSTGSSASQPAGTLQLLVLSPEDQPLPTSVV
jgi:hypothetical protein